MKRAPSSQAQAPATPVSHASGSYDLAEAVGLLNTAKIRADAGGEVDLRELPERVERICQFMAALPPGEALGYLEVAQKLINDLGVLQDKLGAHKRVMRRQLQEMRDTEQDHTDRK